MSPSVQWLFTQAPDVASEHVTSYCAMVQAKKLSDTMLSALPVASMKLFVPVGSPLIMLPWIALASDAAMSIATVAAGSLKMLST